MVFINSSGENLGKVFAVRRRRPIDNGCTQRSSSVTNWHEDDGSIPTGALPLLPSNRSYSWVVSSVREVFDPGATSLAGPPMEDAIAILLAILQVIYRHGHHKADLDHLTVRLHRLVNWYLWNATTARDLFEHSRRDFLVRILQETSAQLKILHKRGLSYIPVTQTIARCSIEIDRYLLGCLWSQMQQSQNNNNMHDMRESRENHEHPVPVNIYTSFQVCLLMMKIREAYSSNSSNLIRCSKFCLNVTRLQPEIMLSRKDSTICPLTVARD